MTSFRSVFLTLLASACASLAIAAPASAEENTPPALLPFDPLALEFTLPGSTISNNIWNVRSLPVDHEPIGNVTYSWNGQTKTISRLLLESGTDAFLVLENGKIAHEVYFDINNVFTRHQSWSMMKSFVSTLVGIAVRDGKITSVNDPVTKYVPALAANGYNGVSIKDVLQMSSGIDWNEEYTDILGADIVDLVLDPILDNGSFGLFGRTLDKFAASPEWSRSDAPGTRFLYNSLNTQVLGMVLKAATGRPVRKLLEEQIWRPSGMGSSGWLLKDRAGSDFGFCCLYATARDYARFGLVWENNGARGSNQIVPTNWVYDSTHSTEAHLQPGVVEPTLGYGYQWWIGDGTRGDFAAIGVEGQWTYVSPTDNTVIVKLSDDLTLEGNREEEFLKASRAVADYLRAH
ncbi:MAG: serine hydrolase [Thermoleophilaceae bacterium]|nr:serine hydrolase [Thermoleophilaceae bacterium]